ncbi:efflux RND transporter periplasmic adaptor subunit [Alteromonas naphthalenivorans]|nr:efflux RND transporter periplasmic adaptor subunit [Alteromonas naphthalenivorans]
MVEDTVRSVKTLTITENTKANSRQLAGTVESTDESELSFRVGGRVASVDVSSGEKIIKGQLLATLEKKEYELAVQSAKAKLASARAEFKEKSDALKRQQNLRAKEFVAQASVDQAQAAFTAANSNVDVAVTDLENAQQDLENTELLAPFDGSIVTRSIEPFTEVAAGSTVFELQSQGAMKVEVLMPETLIREISYGDSTSVQFPTLKGVTVYGAVSKIGSKAQKGNAFPVSVELAQTTEDIRPGMTAQVTFNYGEAADASVYLIPITALDVRIPVENESSLEKEVPVFVLKDGVAQRRKLTFRDIRGNKLEVIDGLSPGDVLITAGVPFINEGQKVKAWEPTYNLPAVIQ